MERVAVLDFETTGISPSQGDRPTEIAIAVVEQGRIVDRFQSLMNPGRRIPSFVTQLTGITNDMVASAPAVAEVMREAARFVGRLPVVAHNASFDRKFWVAELKRLALDADSPFACTMLLARRLYPESPNHQLGTLVRTLQLPQSGRAHRAMVDAEMASHLWCRIGADLSQRYGVAPVSHALLARVQATPRAKLDLFLSQLDQTV
ncbi:3'-5' exonuclease [Azohydromonas australica]|uniref:3'-5' exonuclease n=1 Tax=Azohydromonas australica TaxID=364039 RepID=UPI0004226742|nr:3'-5' exonuclease [Azohydromonas australica]